MLTGALAGLAGCQAAPAPAQLRMQSRWDRTGDVVLAAPTGGFSYTYPADDVAKMLALDASTIRIAIESLGGVIHSAQATNDPMDK